MRDYAKVAPQFWTGRTGKLIRSLGHEAQVLALYLMTGPNANMIGLYYLPIPTMAHETGSPLEGASKALRSLCEVDFCAYDEDAEVVWVREMARFQIGESLDGKDKRIAGVMREFESVPKSRLHNDFWSRYSEPFSLPARELDKPLRRGFEGPSEPLRSQDQDQDQDQKHEQDSHTARARVVPIAVDRLPRPAVDPDLLGSLWDRWRRVQPLAPLTASPKELMTLQEMAETGVTADEFEAIARLFVASPDTATLRSLGVLRSRLGELRQWLQDHPGVPYDRAALKRATAVSSDGVPSAEATQAFLRQFRERA